MKKLTILTIVIVLLALATPVMSDVVVSGNVKYGVTLGPNTAAGDDMTSEQKQEARITVTGTPDDNNTATLTLKLDDADAVDVSVDKAIYETNLLAAFGLGDIPVSVKLTGGFWEWANEDVGKVSGYEVEDVINTKNKSWQFQIDTSIMDMVTIRVGLDPEFSYQSTSGLTPSNSDDANIGYLLGAFGGAGPVMAEVFYTNTGAAADESGDLGIGAGVTLGFGDIGIKIGANVVMNLDTTDDYVAQLGFGVKFTYGTLLSAGVGYYGFIADEDVLGTDSSSPANLIGINVDVTPIDMITIFAGMKIGLDSDVYDDAFRLLDVGLKTKAGALELAAGYQYRPDSATDDDPGKEDLYPYVTNSAEGGVFIQGNLAF